MADHHPHAHEWHGPAAHRGGQRVPAPADFGKAFAIGIGLNVVFVLVEAVCGITANSVALLADAGHNLSDVLGLAAAWGASLLSQRQPSGRYTYGLRSSTILAALANAVVLLVVTGGVIWEAILRLERPESAAGLTIVVVAAVGIAVNGITALLFAAGGKGDLNIKGAFLHMVSDTGVTAGVVVAGAVIYRTGWLWLDPAVSIAIGLVIVAVTWSLLRDSANLALHAVPGRIDQNRVASYLASLPGVTAVHDLHIWGMSTTETALTAHLVRPELGPPDAFLHEVAHELEERFGIGHSTLQLETADETCRLAPNEVV